MTVSIPLTRSYVAIIDEIDADLANSRWYAQYQRSPIYVTNGKQYMHRVIMARIVGRQLSRLEVVDHINHDALDNRRSNLRIATHRQNLANSRQHKNKKTLYKGVHFHPGNKNPFTAQIYLNGKLKHLGCFLTAETAHVMYCLAAYAQWGEYASFGENSFVPKKSESPGIVFDAPVQLPLPLAA